MKRREFTALASAAPLAASAQEAGRTYRLGFLFSTAKGAPHHLALFEELRRAGFVEGQNLTIDWRGFGLRLEEFAEHAAELTKSQTDVVICGGDVAIPPRNGQRRRFQSLR